jgi:simple sugar transport system substrate-binding protein
MNKIYKQEKLNENVDKSDTYYFRRINDVLNGTWKSQSSWDGMAEGTVGMAPYTNMPDDVAKAANETAEAIKTGKLHPFTGPITKQDGTVVGEAGKGLPDGDILGMNWYVKGVDDQLPQ